MQVTLKLEPLFKRSITYVRKDDHDLGDEALMFGTQHEFADITWYPSQHKAVYRVDDRVPPLTPGNGLYDFSGFRSTLSLVLATIRSLGEYYYMYLSKLNLFLLNFELIFVELNWI